MQESATYSSLADTLASATDMDRRLIQSCEVANADADVTAMQSDLDEIPVEIAEHWN